MIHIALYECESPARAEFTKSAGLKAVFEPVLTGVMSETVAPLLVF